MIQMDIKQKLAQVDASNTDISLSDFDEMQEAEPGEWSTIGSYEAETPILLRRDKPLRMVLPVFEEFDHNGGEESYELNFPVLEQRNTRTAVAYVDGDRAPSELDYEEGEITVDYEDVGDLEVYYVTEEPGEIEIQIAAPRAQNSVSQTVFDETTKLLFVKDQNKEPAFFEASDPMDLIVPRKWDIEIRVKSDADYSLAVGDEEHNQVPSNAIVDFEVRKASDDVEGLSQAKKRHIVA